MPENKDKKQSVDLSELLNVDFASGWSSSSSSNSFKSDSPRERKPFDKNRNRTDFKRKSDFTPRQTDGEGRKSFPKRDFRKTERRPDSENSRPSAGEHPRSSYQKKQAFRAPQEAPEFIFSMEVSFFPEDAPFTKLVELMRHLKRTYQLFEIAHILLEKPERYVVVAKNLPSADGTIKPLYCAQPMNIPYEDEASAKKAAIDYHVEDLFEKVQVEREAPKGNFQVVNKCGVTGEILGAPNWHRYNEFLREFHRERLPNMSFDRFTSSITSSREQSDIDSWLENMKNHTAYKLKETGDIFDTYENASNYVSVKLAADLVKAYEHVRISAVNVEKLPRGRIRNNIEQQRLRQLKFPLETANNLRGRLRRTGFTIYKRGSKGYAFVCAVRRKFLLEGEKLSETPQKIHDFLTMNQGLTTVEFPYKFLGIENPSEVKTPKSLAEENNSEIASEKTSAEAPAIDEETYAKISELSNELHWLVAEGYVVEYSDGKLQANAYLPKPKEKPAKKKATDAESEVSSDSDEPLVEEAQSDVASEEEVVAQESSEAETPAQAEEIVEEAKVESADSVEETPADNADSEK